MESKLDILRKPTQEGKLEHMFGRGRKLLHKTQENLDEQHGKSARLISFPQGFPQLFACLDPYSTAEAISHALDLSRPMKCIA